MKRKRKSPLRSAFLWLLLTIVVALLLYVLKDFLNHHALLVARVHEQSQQINDLTTQLHGTQAQLEVANTKIDSLVNAKLVQQAPKVTISGVPTPQEHTPQIISAPVVIVTVLAVLKGLASLVPAF